VTTSRPIDLGATVAGVRFPFCAMNASGSWSATTADLRELTRSESGAIVLKTATVHAFVHPAYRSLHNPGFDKLATLVRELVTVGDKPVVASIAGSTVDEYVTLARAFAEAGAAIVEANLVDPWVTATLAPLEDPGVLRELATRLVDACPVPVAVKLPESVPLAYQRLVAEMVAARVAVVVVRNTFSGLEKLLLETGRKVEVVAVGDISSGYDVSRALAKGASAVQVESSLTSEGPGIFARLAREMRAARGDRA
jgi:dihydroorotate dehydrogenase (fumarate)